MGPEESRINELIGAHFRRTRETLGWSLKEVSERAGKEGAQISLSTLSRFERGQASFSFFEMLVLSRALGTPVAYIDELIREAGTRAQIDISGKTHEQLVAMALKHMRTGNFGRASAVLEAAHDRYLLLPEQERLTTELAQVLILSADCRKRLRQFILASQLVTCALNLPKLPHDYYVRALAMDVSIAHMSGDFHRARVYAAQIAPLLDSASAPVRAYALAIAGNVEFKSGNFADALPWYTRAEQIYRDAGELFNWLKVSVALGTCLYRSGKRAEGLERLQESANKALEHSFRGQAAIALRALAEAKAEEGKIDEAREELESALALARKLERDEFFLTWYTVWRVERDHGSDSRARNAARVLKRSIRHIDPTLPEAVEFLAAVGRSDPGRTR